MVICCGAGALVQHAHLARALLLITVQCGMSCVDEPAARRLGPVRAIRIQHCGWCFYASIPVRCSEFREHDW